MSASLIDYAIRTFVVVAFVNIFVSIYVVLTS